MYWEVHCRKQKVELVKSHKSYPRGNERCGMKLSCTFDSAIFELFLSLRCKYTHPEAAKMGTFSVDCGS